jgi:hypothetical protein
LVVTTGIGAGPDYRDLRGAFVIGAPLGASPAWSGSDVWPLSGVSLSGADVSTASLAFTGGYMVERTLVARPGGMGLLTIGATEGARIELPITHLTVTMNVSNDGMSATNGIVSGVIPTERLVDAARVLVAALPPNGFCRQAFESVASTLRQASDILVDGSIAPNKPCDGVSIGLGFEATRVALGPVVAAPAPIDNCADADGGADAAGD